MGEGSVAHAGADVADDTGLEKGRGSSASATANNKRTAGTQRILVHAATDVVLSAMSHSAESRAADGRTTNPHAYWITLQLLG